MANSESRYPTLLSTGMKNGREAAQENPIPSHPRLLAEGTVKTKYPPKIIHPQVQVKGPSFSWLMYWTRVFTKIFRRMLRANEDKEKRNKKHTCLYRHHQRRYWRALVQVACFEEHGDREYIPCWNLLKEILLDMHTLALLCRGLAL